MTAVEVERQLPKDLADQEVGETRVRDVRVEVREDADGESAIFIALVLSDPRGKAETWPVKDLWRLRSIVHDAIARLDPPFSWFVEFVPESPGGYEGDDVGEPAQPDD
jgi:hypothetical protein